MHQGSIRRYSRPDVRKRIGERNGERNRERAAWDREHGPGPGVEYFRQVVLPKIVRTRTSSLARETGLSVNYCATIKAGKHTPNPLTGRGYCELHRSKKRPASDCRRYVRHQNREGQNHFRDSPTS
jgi:hypothetical protein